MWERAGARRRGWGPENINAFELTFTGPSCKARVPAASSSGRLNGGENVSPGVSDPKAQACTPPGCLPEAERWHQPQGRVQVPEPQKGASPDPLRRREKTERWGEAQGRGEQSRRGEAEVRAPKHQVQRSRGGEKLRQTPGMLQSRAGHPVVRGRSRAWPGWSPAPQLPNPSPSCPIVPGKPKIAAINMWALEPGRPGFVPQLHFLALGQSLSLRQGHCGGSMASHGLSGLPRAPWGIMTTVMTRLLVTLPITGGLAPALPSPRLPPPFHALED